MLTRRTKQRNQGHLATAAAVFNVVRRNVGSAHVFLGLPSARGKIAGKRFMIMDYGYAAQSAETPDDTNRGIIPCKETMTHERSIHAPFLASRIRNAANKISLGVAHHR